MQSNDADSTVPTPSLKGVFISFSGFDDGDTQSGSCYSSTTYREKAKLLGARTQTTITTRTNVVIARRGLTRKRLVAEQRGIPVVLPQWIEKDASMRASRLSMYQVPYLYGYSFFACEMLFEEYEALAVLIKRNGGTLVHADALQQCDVVLVGSECAGELKKMRQLLGSHQSDTVPLPLSNFHSAISAAWQCELPVLEYMAFLRLANLTEESHAGGASDFETILSTAQLLPPPRSYPEESAATQAADGWDTQWSQATLPPSADALSIMEEAAREEPTVVSQVPLHLRSLAPQFGPVLVVSLIGCTQEEYAVALSCCARCGFLLTCIASVATDVVVLGSLAAHRKKAVKAASVGVGPRHLRSGLQSALGAAAPKTYYEAPRSIRDQLQQLIGIHVSRITPLGWLRECGARARCAEDALESVLETQNDGMSIGPSSQLHQVVSERAPQSRPFCLADAPHPGEEPFRLRFRLEPAEIRQAPSPAPAPQNEISAASQEPEQHSLLSAAPPPPPTSATPSQEVGDGERYYRDRRTAQTLLEEALKLVRCSSRPMPASSSFHALASVFCCFVDGEFSRVESSVARGIVRAGGGQWMKKDASAWIAFCRSGAGELAKDGLSDAQEFHAAIRRRRHFEKQRKGAEASQQSPAELFPCSSQTSSLHPTQAPLVYHVVPHHYQMPAISEQPTPAPRGKQRTPTTSSVLPYIPRVTSDFLLCTMAAERVLDPSSIFIFHTPLPSRSELALMGHQRKLQAASSTGGSQKVPRLSEWVWTKRYRKPQTVGVNVFFTYRLPEPLVRADEDSPSPSSLGLRIIKVLFLALHQAVRSVGGSVRDAFEVDAVTHILLVDVAAVYGSDSSQCIWPSVDYSVTASEEVSFVTTKWLEDCVQWGVFVDELLLPEYKWQPPYPITRAVSPPPQLPVVELTDELHAARRLSLSQRCSSVVKRLRGQLSYRSVDGDNENEEERRKESSPELFNFQTPQKAVRQPTPPPLDRQSTPTPSVRRIPEGNDEIVVTSQDAAPSCEPPAARKRQRSATPPPLQLAKLVARSTSAPPLGEVDEKRPAQSDTATAVELWTTVNMYVLHDVPWPSPRSRQEFIDLQRSTPVAGTASGGSVRVKLVRDVEAATLVVSNELRPRSSLLAALASGAYYLHPSFLQAVCAECSKAGTCVIPLSVLSNLREQHEWSPSGHLLPALPRLLLRRAAFFREERHIHGRRPFKDFIFVVWHDGTSSSQVTGIQQVIHGGGGAVAAVACLTTDVCSISVGGASPAVFKRDGAVLTSQWLTEVLVTAIAAVLRQFAGGASEYQLMLVWSSPLLHSTVSTSSAALLLKGWLLEAESLFHDGTAIRQALQPHTRGDGKGAVMSHSAATEALQQALSNLSAKGRCQVMSQFSVCNAEMRWIMDALMHESAQVGGSQAPGPLLISKCVLQVPAGLAYMA